MRKNTKHRKVFPEKVPLTAKNRCKQDHKQQRKDKKEERRFNGIPLDSIWKSLTPEEKAFYIDQEKEQRKLYKLRLLQKSYDEEICFVERLVKNKRKKNEEAMTE